MSSTSVTQYLSEQPYTLVIAHESGIIVNKSSPSEESPEPGKHSTHRTLHSATSQLTIVGALFFLGPGMFNAMNGLGGGGLHNPGPINTANVAVYSTLAIVGFLSGPIVTKIGFRASFAMAGMAYSLYASSILSYKLDSSSAFLVFAGIVLGVFSSLMWTSQGAMLISYPRPEERGRYISLVWGLFNLGTGLGSLLVFVLSIHSKEEGISIATFAVFISLMFCCTLGAIFIVSPAKVTRSHGENVTPVRSTTWGSAFKGLAYCLRTHTRIIALFPMFFVSNYYYPYIFNDMNLRTFNIRTRALNNALFWMMEIPGSLVTGLLLDQKSHARPARARLGFCLVLALTVAVWVGGCVWQQRYSRAVTASPSFTPIDLSDAKYAAPAILFLCYGFYDAAWQSFIFWLLGAIGGDSNAAAELTGFYKGLQSAGAAVAFRTNMLQNQSLTDLIVVWSMLLAALAVAAPVILFRIGY